ncbi:MAG: DUF2764 domain-containing protein [Bacteroidales bacterium]|nr:DUF2764 domain-containing protein [Bacteroidales bacterium]
MRNYEYIIASLPDLVLDFKAREFDYPSLVKEVKSLCSEKDCGLIDILSSGLADDGKCPCRFLTEYFGFDKEFREAKVAFLEGRPYDKSFAPVFSEKNLIEREKKIDALYWQKISESVTFDVFTFDIILSILAKAKIVARWSALDQTAGETLFRELVQEVRGTFKGVKIEEQ